MEYRGLGVIFMALIFALSPVGLAFGQDSVVVLEKEPVAEYSVEEVNDQKGIKLENEQT